MHRLAWLLALGLSACTEAREGQRPPSDPDDGWIAIPQTGDLEFEADPPHGVVELRVRAEDESPVPAVSLQIDEIGVPWSTADGDPLFVAIPEGEHLMELSVWEASSEEPLHVKQYFAAARGCRLSLDVVTLEGGADSKPGGAHVEQRLRCLYANPIHAIPEPRPIPAMPASAERSAAARWVRERQRQAADSVMYVSLALASARDEQIFDMVACLDPKLMSLQEIHRQLRRRGELTPAVLPPLPHDLESIEELATRLTAVQLAARRCL
jgi:hypothetical protein